ncbi:hypothetical protein [Vibrio agarivorans]|uniref:hypothetical protein n=1 Tax=Vibrio agarivorans TaxID=153622 RepID=UPI002230924F|nr:hypothetical protein [Vibrio agarivorans]
MKKLLLGAALLSVLAGCASSDKPYEASITNKERTSSAMQIVSTVGGQGYFDDQRLPKNALNETTTGDYLVGTAAGFVFDTALAGFMYTLAGSNMNSWDQTNVIVFLDESEFLGLTQEQQIQLAASKVVTPLAISTLNGLNMLEGYKHKPIQVKPIGNTKWRNDHYGVRHTYTGHSPDVYINNIDGKDYFEYYLSLREISSPIETGLLTDTITKDITSPTFIAVRFIVNAAISHDFYAQDNWMMPKNTFLLDKAMKMNGKKSDVPALIGHSGVYLFLRPQDGKQITVATEDYKRISYWLD